MTGKFDRATVVARLRAEVDGGSAIYDALCGSGITAKMAARGRPSMGLFTKAFCSSVDEALAMAEASVDNIIIHFGNSSGGTIGSKTVIEHDAALRRAAAILDALSARFSERLVTCHGGAIETPAD